MQYNSHVSRHVSCNLYCSIIVTKIEYDSLEVSHNASPVTLIPGGTVLKESDDLVILGVTFDSKMTFEKHLCSVSRSASQRLGRQDFASPGECSTIDRFLGDAFGVLSCTFWSIVLQSGAWLQIHTLNYWTEQSVHGARFLTEGVFEFDISHRRSVTVLCMIYKIRCDPVHHLNGALPGPYVPARVTRGALVAHRYAVQQDFYFLLGVPLERSC